MGTLEQTVFGKSIQSSSVTHVSGKCRFGTSQLTPNVAEDCSVVSPKYLMSLKYKNMVITKYCPVQKIHLPLGPSLRVSFQTITGSISSSPMSPNVISGVNCIFLTVNQNPRYLNSIKYYNFVYYVYHYRE